MSNSVLIVGGGIAGIQASLDLANRGTKVFLVEKTPSIGGRMAQLDKTFPTLDCSICILAPKMIECFRHPNITLLTYSEVKEVSGNAGNFTVKVLQNPRYVMSEKCTGCGTCMEKCPVKVPNEFDMGLGTRKAIYMPFKQAVPLVATIDQNSCLYFTKGVCKVCQKVCPSAAVNYEQNPKETTLKVSSIILATGFDTFDLSAMKEYGYGRFKNVINSMEFERLICASGPTGGHLLRPSDGKEPKSIVFVQCVGSRSQRGELPYCSSVCCVYATKESILVKDHLPDTEVNIMYMDMRAVGKGFQEFVDRAKSQYGVNYIKSHPGGIAENPKTKSLQVYYEDIRAGCDMKKLDADMVVLCPALIPKGENRKIAEATGVELDDYGFFKSRNKLTAPVETNIAGIYVCGYCQSPKDIPESVAQASGAAAKAAETITCVSEEAKR
ncbi:MAG TPA: CoB--CoM heterodisulfide reductase iron-sulfur subunit A family protein [Candidatus Acidoferrum sp.]|nr:CoB--CoM heterodisulfide reductase iron-sulfur subunit A family protein [Candidatus Acidoferrum sp.]